MKCNGKCYLAKQLKKAQQEEEKQNSKRPAPRNLKLKSMDWISFTVAIEAREELAYACTATAFRPETTAGIFTFSNPVFHPPTAV